MGCGCNHCECEFSYGDYLNSRSINELQEELSIKNNSLYELKSTANTLARQNIDNNEEMLQISSVKNDIKLIQTVLNSKKESKDVLSS